MKTEHIPKSGGVYAIVNEDSHDMYIGSTQNMRKRAYGHISSLRKNFHKSKKLQNDWNELEGESFTFEVLHEMPEYSHSIARKYEGDLIQNMAPKYNTYQNRSFNFAEDNVLLLQLDNDSYQWAIQNKHRLASFISESK